MKHILFITPVVPDANGGGREKRAHQWVTKLCLSHQVHLLIINRNSKKLNHLTSENSFRNTLAVCYSKRQKFLQLFRCVLSLFTRSLTGAPNLYWIPITQLQKAQLSKHYTGVRYDRIICFRLYLSEYALFLNQVTNTDSLELDMDDLESNTWRSVSKLLLDNKEYKQACLSLLTAWQFAFNEKKAANLFKCFYLCSEDDKFIFGKRTKGTTVEVFSNKINGKPVNPKTSIKAPILLFIGTLSYYPNFEAIVWFAKQVFPILKQRIPNLKLHVVGYAAPDYLKDLFAQEDAIHLYENVPSVEEVYQGAYAVISPLHAGGGTKLKVLEAMWHGLPLIATQESVRGLNLQEGIHYLAADTSEEFISKCELLFRNQALYKLIATEASSFVQEKYHY